MRKIIICIMFLTLSAWLVACDGGSSSNSGAFNRTNSRQLPDIIRPTQPPSNTDPDPDSDPDSANELEAIQFEREFDARLSTPRPLFEDEDEDQGAGAEQPTIQPTPDQAQSAPIETPTSGFSLGSPYPTRSGYPTSTPYTIP